MDITKMCLLIQPGMTQIRNRIEYVADSGILDIVIHYKQRRHFSQIINDAVFIGQQTVRFTDSALPVFGKAPCIRFYSILARNALSLSVFGAPSTSLGSPCSQITP